MYLRAIPPPPPRLMISEQYGNYHPAPPLALFSRPSSSQSAHQRPQTYQQLQLHHQEEHHRVGHILSAFGLAPRSSHRVPAILPPQHVQDHGKVTLVLDLDETLVHAEFLPDEVKVSDEVVDVYNAKYAQDTNTFCIRYRGKGVLVRKRPHLDEFLLAASERYEIIAFTAGMEEYAEAVLDHLDPTGSIFRHRLYRQHCSENGFVKDLRILNRDLARTVLVDNSHTSFLFQLDNGIPIESFTNDVSDNALLMLASFLDAIKYDQDVRVQLRDIFKMETKMLMGGFDQDLHQYQQIMWLRNRNLVQ